MYSIQYTCVCAYGGVFVFHQDFWGGTVPIQKAYITSNLVIVV